MKTQIEVHPIQAKILVSLLFKRDAKFSELNITELTNDHFSFHIKQLLENKLIEKTNNQKYTLTKHGKEFANRFDTDNKLIERQAKIGVLIQCIKKVKNKTKYLVQQRLKQPYYGFYGGITGKIRWGETIKEAAKRELKEETGLSGKMELVGVKHKMDYSQENQLLEDKFFFVFRATETKGKFIKIFEGGKNIWKTKNEVLKLPNLFADYRYTLKMVDKSRLSFLEMQYKVEKY